MRTETHPIGTLAIKKPYTHKGSGRATLRQLSPQFINAKPQKQDKNFNGLFLEPFLQ